VAWSFDSLKYGWKIPVGIVLAGTTIYVAGNLRARINQVDVIEPVLGTHERCLAAGIAPLEFVRQWYSNAYESTVTTGVVDGVTNWTTNWTAVLYTNVFTNVIGWRKDRAMLVSTDAKIKELAPYFVDTNSVYDGTTNIIMHTFTGLLASLNIGVGGTNFTAYGWRVGTNELRERCAVLNSLETTIDQFFYASSRCRVGVTNKYAFSRWTYPSTSWVDAVAHIADKWVNDPERYSYNSRLTTIFPSINYSAGAYLYNGLFDGADYWASASAHLVTNLFSETTFSTNVPHNVQFWYYQTANPQADFEWGVGSSPSFPMDYESDGFPSSDPGWHMLSESGYTNTASVSWDVSIGCTNFDPIPPVCDNVVSGSSHQIPYTYPPNPVNSNIWAEARGGPSVDGARELYHWMFQYCTNSLN